MKKLKFLLIFLCLFSFFSFSQKVAVPDSLLTALHKATLDSEKADIQLAISKYYLKVMPDSVENYALNALRFYKTQGIMDKAFDATMILAGYYKSQACFEKAIRCIQETMELITDKKYLVQISRCNLEMGELSRAEENFKNGISYLNESLRIASQILDKHLIAECHNRFAAIYFEMGDFNNAIQYADSSLKISKKIKDNELILNNLDILGATYRSKKDFRKAMKIHDESLSLASKLSNNQSILPNLYRNIATTYYYMGNYQKSIEFAKISYAMAEKEKVWVYMENAAINLYYSYAHLEDYKMAFKYSEILREISKDLQRRQMNYKISELNAKFETVQKERLIEVQQNELKNNQLLLENKKSQQKALLIGLVGLLVPLILLIIMYYQKRRDHIRIKLRNERISDKNTELELLAYEIMEKARELKKNNEKLVNLTEFKENITYMMVHDLKNPLSAIIGFSSMQPSERNYRFIHESSSDMLNLVVNILDVQKYEKMEMKVDKRLQTLNSMLGEAFGQVEYPLLTKKLNVINLVEDDLDAYFDREIIIRVVVNLLTNSIKYSPENGIITIDAKRMKNDHVQFVRISVHNSGESIPEDKIEAIFEKYHQINPKNLGVSYSTGIGLSFCKLAINAHKGDIGVESSQGNGTKFWFSLEGKNE